MTEDIGSREETVFQRKKFGSLEIAVLLAVAFMFSACSSPVTSSTPSTSTSSGGTVATPLDPGVYVAGYVLSGSGNYPSYWEGQTLHVLPVPTGGYYGIATGISADSSGNVYVAGYTEMISGGAKAPAYWKNGTLYQLDEGGGVQGLTDAIVLDSSGNTFVTGDITTGTTGNYTTKPCFWENGSLNTLSDGNAVFGYADKPWFDSSGNIYFSGAVGTNQVTPTPAYWKMTGEQNPTTMYNIMLDGSSANGDVIRGEFDNSANLYLVGDSGSLGSLSPGYSKNGTYSALPLGNGNTYWTEGGDVLDSSGNLHISGSVGPSAFYTEPVDWKNGVQAGLPIGPGKSIGVANDEACDSQGNLYIAGYVGSDVLTPIASYWKNGVLKTLPMNSSLTYGYATAITCVK